MSSDSAVHQKLEELSKSALAKAKQLKCEGAKVSAKSDVSLRVSAENRKFTIASSVTSQSFGLAVHKDRKRGSAAVNTVKSEDVVFAVEEALQLAKYSVPDEYLTLASKEIAPRAKPLDFLHDKKLTNVDQIELQELMEDILENVFTDERIALERFDVGVSDSYHNLMNSEGVFQSEVQTSIGWSFMGMARAGDQVSGMDYTGGFSYSSKDFRERMRREAEQFAQKLVASLDPIKCPEYKGNVLLTPRAVRSLILSHIMFHASGSSVMDGKSKWIKSVGEEVCSPLLMLSDHPHAKHFSGATSFDSDGLPTRDTSIIERGILKSHLHSCYTAKRTGTTSNGFAGGAFGLILAPGATLLDDLKNSSNELLVVDRFSGNTDPLTGDFSGVAKSSRLLRNGRDVGPVSETMIAGNMLELLRSIAGVSKETEIVGGSYSAPYVLLGPVTVS
jgi:PmbA protein